MRIAGKEISDECQYCGELLQCMLFIKGHGIRCEREHVAAMIRCQLEHMEKRRK